MSYEAQSGIAWKDWSPSGPTLAALGAVIVAALIGIHGIVHVLFAPASSLQVSIQGVLIILWGLTTLMALGGLAVLGGAYASLVNHAHTGPKVDVEILPKDERSVLKPILEMSGVTQVEVVARSDFSDAKISQTLKTLRERGLVYREPQGRTYRLYPGTIISEMNDES